MPLLIESDVALLVVQESVADCPWVFVVGLAVKLEMIGAAGGGGVGVTTMVTCDVAVPALFDAVIV